MWTGWRWSALLMLYMDHHIRHQNPRSLGKRQESYGFFATILFFSVPPILFDETSTTSPTFRNLSGIRFPSSSLWLESRAVPAHVPDAITSPGFRTTSAERYSTHSPNPLIMSLVFPLCLTSPFTEVEKSMSWGSGASSVS